MLGLIWWPMIDQLDWDGALTHRIGKIHEVGLFKLKRQQDGTLSASRRRWSKQFTRARSQRRRTRRQTGADQLSVGRERGRAASADRRVDSADDRRGQIARDRAVERHRTRNGNGNGNGNRATLSIRRVAAEPAAGRLDVEAAAIDDRSRRRRSRPTATASSSSATCAGASSGSARSSSSRASPRSIRSSSSKSRSSIGRKAPSRDLSSIA